MIHRRQFNFGLLASLSLPLAGCGGGLTPGEGGGALPRGKKQSWQPSFGNELPHADAAGFKRRTSPATMEELLAPGPLKEMELGNPRARVTVIEYFSLTCPVCRAFHAKTWPAFRKRYIDSGKIRFIAREFPIGRSSGNASIALRCVDEKRYFPLINHFLANQHRWVSQNVRLDAIHKVAAPYGLSRAKFDSCLANQALIDNIRAVKQRGRELGVIGTPTFFINGKQLRGALTLRQLQAEIDPLLAA